MLACVLRRVMWVALAFACHAAALTPPRPGHVFIDLAVGPRGELVASHSDGVFRSVDGGRSWRQMLPESGGAIVFDAGAHGLYANGAALYRSENWGASWSPVGAPHRIDAADSEGTLYGCREPDLERSRDGGRTWSPTSRPSAPAGAAWSCRNVFSTRDAIYAWSWAMLARSGDGGATWTSIDTSAAGGSSHENFHVDAAGGLYLNSTSLEGPPHLQSIFRSRDEGRTWQRLTFGETSSRVGFRLLVVRGTTLFVEIQRIDPRGETMPWDSDIRASAAGGPLRPLGVRPHITVIDAHIVPSGEVIYIVDMYKITEARQTGTTGRRSAGRASPTAIRASPPSTS